MLVGDSGSCSLNVNFPGLNKDVRKALRKQIEGPIIPKFSSQSKQLHTLLILKMGIKAIAQSSYWSLATDTQ